MSKNVWKPTESELEEMGFVGKRKIFSERYSLLAHYDYICYEIYAQGDDSLENMSFEWEIFVAMKGLGSVPFYPESRQDVETLIRLMTP